MMVAVRASSTSSVSHMLFTEPLPLPDRGEEQRGGEDPAGERGWCVEGLLWWCVSGDSGWVRYEIRRGVHLSGYDVSTTLIHGLLLHQSVIVSFGRVEDRKRRERNGVVKVSSQQNHSLEDYKANKCDWFINENNNLPWLNWSWKHTSLSFWFSMTPSSHKCLPVFSRHSYMHTSAHAMAHHLKIMLYLVRVYSVLGFSTTAKVCIIHPTLHGPVSFNILLATLATLGPHILSPVHLISRFIYVIFHSTTH